MMESQFETQSTDAAVAKAVELFDAPEDIIVARFQNQTILSAFCFPLITQSSFAILRFNPGSTPFFA